MSLSTPDGVDVWHVGNAYVVTDVNGNSVRAELNTGWMNASVGLGHFAHGSRDGLLADVNGETGALAARDGTVLTNPFSFEEFYTRYGDSWRVAPPETLLSPCGEPKEESNPNGPSTANDLDQDAQGRARAACEKAGVTEQDIAGGLHAGCPRWSRMRPQRRCSSTHERRSRSGPSTRQSCLRARPYPLVAASLGWTGRSSGPESRSTCWSPFDLESGPSVVRLAELQLAFDTQGGGEGRVLGSEGAPLVGRRSQPILGIAFRAGLCPPVPDPPVPQLEGQQEPLGPAVHVQVRSLGQHAGRLRDPVEAVELAWMVAARSKSIASADACR